MKKLLRSVPLLGRYLRTTEGLGTLVMVSASGVAVGVVPNVIEGVLEQALGTALLFFGIFVVAVLASILGWLLRQQHGIAVYLPWFPAVNADSVLAVSLPKHIEKSHSAVVKIGPRLIAPGGKRLPLGERGEIFRELLEAKVQEFVERGLATDTTVYCQAPLHEAFVVGQILGTQHLTSLTIAHLPRVNSELAAPMVNLGELSSAVTEQQKPIVEEYFPSHDAERPISLYGSAAEQDRSTLAVVIRMVDAGAMVQDVTGLVAKTGEVRRADRHRTHTGFVFAADDIERPGSPCGAYVVIEAARVPLKPETQATFEAATTYLYSQISAAQQRYQAMTGGAITTRIFVAGPLPIVMGLGWLLKNDGDTTSVVEHRRHLLNTRKKPMDNDEQG